MNKVSVIVPVYKVEKYLDRCVQSVVEQSYQNLEIILVDDGSPDNCPAMCDEWAIKDKRIKVIHKKNGGVSSARNLGLEKATGDYIAFVDSDDWIELNMYEEMLKSANREKADIVFCRQNKVSAKGQVEKISEIRLSNLKNKEIIYLFKFGNNDSVRSGPCRMLVKTEIAKMCKFPTSLNYGEDLFFVVDCVEKARKIEIVDKYFYNYFYNSESVTSFIDDNYFRNIKDLYSYQKDFINNKHLDWEYLINHSYLFRNVTKRRKQKDFVKVMKSLEKNDEIFRNCFNKQNYKKIQKQERRIKNKLRNFIVYHKMWRLIKIIGKLS